MDNNSNNENKKSTIATITYGLFVILILVGASYALFDYSFLGSGNTITQDEMEIEFLESSNDVIGLTNAIPLSDEEGRSQPDTFDFQVRTKTKNDTDIGYSLILERVQTLCGDLDNPNKDDYPECYNVIISDTDKDKLISYIVTLNIGGGKSISYGADAPSSNLTTEQATELYNYIIAHDKEGIYNFYISMGAWEEDAQYIANMFEAEGYELYLIELYQNNTGETITPTYEFDNTKTYGSIEQLKDKDVKIYLEDYQGNVLLEPTKISEISSDYVIYTKINIHDSTNENIKYKYKIILFIYL